MESTKELRILCIDDGVFQGILSLKVLKLLKCYLGNKEIGQSFDVICGTGRCRHLALMIAYRNIALPVCEDSWFTLIEEGFSDKTSQGLFSDNSPYVFVNPTWSKLENTDALRDVLTEALKNKNNRDHVVLQEIEKLGHRVKCFVSLGNALTSDSSEESVPLEDKYFRLNMVVDSSFTKSFASNIAAAQAACSRYLDAPETRQTFERMAKML